MNQAFSGKTLMDGRWELIDAMDGQPAFTAPKTFTSEDVGWVLMIAQAAYDRGRFDANQSQQPEQTMNQAKFKAALADPKARRELLRSSSGISPMLTFPNDNPNATLPRALLVGTLDCSALALFADPSNSHAMARFDLGDFRLFRPDLDQQFTSESGRIWRPVE